MKNSSCSSASDNRYRQVVNTINCTQIKMKRVVMCKSSISSKLIHLASFVILVYTQTFHGFIARLSD